MMIVQGVFRSGTTTLFRALRCDEQVRCYYEPLHPHLLDHVTDATVSQPLHRKSSLFAEYGPIAESVRERFRSDFSREHVLLDAGAEAPFLRSYLRLLIESAPATVLQFNRAFWMARWLGTLHSDDYFVHLVRDPRSVVWSQLTTRSGRVRMNWPVLGRRYFAFSSGNLDRVFSPYAYHGAYQVKEYCDLGHRFLGGESGEALAWAHERLEAAREASPYVQALALWGAQTYVCHAQAQSAFGDRYLVLRYEDLCTSPVCALQRVYALLDAFPPPPVRRFGADQIHARRLAPWRLVNGATSQFRKGIQEAGIGRCMEAMGYDL